MPQFVPVDHDPFEQKPARWTPPAADPVSGQVPDDPVGKVLLAAPGLLAKRAEGFYDTVVDTPLRLAAQGGTTEQLADAARDLAMTMVAPLGVPESGLLSTGARLAEKEAGGGGAIYLADGSAADAGNSLKYNRDGTNYRVDTVALDQANRGKGLGLQMYRRLLDRAQSEGAVVMSDMRVSSDAAKVYDKLKDLGYDVRKAPDTHVSPFHGHFTTESGNPVYEVHPSASDSGDFDLQTAMNDFLSGRKVAGSLADDTRRAVRREGAEHDARLASINPNALPMDENSRLTRAQTMGFDTSTPLYHGTGATFDAFSSGDTYLSPDPKVSDHYAVARGSPEGAQVIRAYSRLRNPRVIHDSTTNINGLVEQAKAAGYDGLVVHGRIDNYGASEKRQVAPQTQVVVFDPTNIRSTSAVFDPSYAGSDILRTGGGVQFVPVDHDPFVQAVPPGVPQT